MPTIRDLKKNINYELATVIEKCYLWQMSNLDKADKAEKIIDEAINSFDEIIAIVNKKGVEDKKAHFKSVNEDLFKSTDKLLKKLVKL